MSFPKLLFFFLFATLLSGCKKNNQYPLASIPFDFTIDLSLPSYQDINAVGGWCYVAGGLKGIIVYRKGIDEFVVWERQSPLDPQGTCSEGVAPKSSNFLELDDPCSDAVFSLYDGSPIQNSQWGLRQYRYDWNGSNLLQFHS
jgi:hypothetical protein